VDSRDRNLSRTDDILVGITPRIADPRGSELMLLRAAAKEPISFSGRKLDCGSC
jgi:hypothetical protein